MIGFLFDVTCFRSILDIVPDIVLACKTFSQNFSELISLCSTHQLDGQVRRHHERIRSWSRRHLVHYGSKQLGEGGGKSTLAVSHVSARIATSRQNKAGCEAILLDLFFFVESE